MQPWDPHRITISLQLLDFCFDDEERAICQDPKAAERWKSQIRATIPKVRLGDIPFAEDLLSFTYHLDHEKELLEALSLLQRAIQVSHDEEGPNSILASRCHLRIAELRNANNDTASTLKSARTAVEIQFASAAPASEARFNVYGSALGHMAGREKADVWTKTFVAAKHEADQVFVDNDEDLLRAYRSLIEWGPFRERLDLMRVYEARIRAIHPANSTSLVEAYTTLASSLAWKDPSSALKIWLKAKTTYDRMPQAEKDLDKNGIAAGIWSGMGAAQSKTGEHNQAVRSYVDAAAAWKLVTPPKPDQVSISWLHAASEALKLNDTVNAEAYFAKGLKDGHAHASYLLEEVASEFGEYYLKAKQSRLAITKLEIAYGISETRNFFSPHGLKHAERLERAYREAGKTSEADAVRMRIAAENNKTKAPVDPATLAKVFQYMGVGWMLAVALGLSLFHTVSSRIEKRPIPAEPVFDLDFAFPDFTLEPVPPAEPPVHKFQFRGEGGEVFAMRVYNLLLTILTLGAFSFWGKTRIRRYLCMQTEFAGDAFGFHGTGGELLRGWLKGMPLIGFLFFFPKLAPILWSNAGALQFVELAASLGLLMLWPIARVGAFRYRLNRMSWRGIRFRMTGRTAEYFWQSMAGYVAMFATFGLASSWLSFWQRQYLYNHTFIGNRAMRFDGKRKDLFRTWVIAWLLTIATLGLFWFWWSAFRSRYHWRHTTLGKARFRCTASGWGLARLGTGNFFLFAFTLGFGTAWCVMRSIRYWTSHIELVGELDEDTITQLDSSANTTGESFADFIGFDFGF